MLQLVGPGASFSEKHQKRMYEGHIKRCKQRPVNGARFSVWTRQEAEWKKKGRKRKKGWSNDRMV